MLTYKDAGVDVTSGYKAVELMKPFVEKTFSKNVIKGMANFGGLYSMDDAPDSPVLVAGTDGVGTKLKLAFLLDRHNTIGIDCVAMCVNDIVCHGAKPLLFLDYIATANVVPETISQIVSGIAEGCLQAGCALLGGETAEMPGFYAEGEYDVAGFSVGVVDRDKLIDGSKVTKGDVLIGLSSSGLHSNGFSLARKLFLDGDKFKAGLDNSLYETLLTPTRIYVKPVLSLIDEFDIHGIAHITGGGFIENIPRILPDCLNAEIELGSWDAPPIFEEIEKQAGLPRDEMYNTFNMGIGMVLAVPKADAGAVLEKAEALGEKAFIIGEAVAGEKEVILCG